MNGTKRIAYKITIKSIHFIVIGFYGILFFIFLFSGKGFALNVTNYLFSFQSFHSYVYKYIHTNIF